MIAYHNDPKIRAKGCATPDALIAAALEAGAWVVDGAMGEAVSLRTGKVLGTRNSRGYIVATLHFSGRRAQVKLHRVVWIAVNGTIPAGMMPDHINRIRDDNRISNLRLVSSAGNAANRRSYRGTGNPACKITARKARLIRISRGSYSSRAKRFGVSKSLVAQISRGELWS